MILTDAQMAQAVAKAKELAKPHMPPFVKITDDQISQFLEQVLAAVTEEPTS